MKLSKIAKKLIATNTRKGLSESTTPNSEVLDYIFDIINTFGDHKLTRLEQEYYEKLKNNNYLDKKLEDKILGIINKQRITSLTIIRDFEVKYGDKFKEYNYGDDYLSIKTKATLALKLQDFLGPLGFKGAQDGNSRRNFDPDMTITDLINSLENSKGTIWYNNTEFLKILKQFLFEYFDDYLSLLAINGFPMEKIK